MSFAARPIDMWAAIGVPTTKAPINVATFVSYVLPPTLLYLVMAYWPSHRRPALSEWRFGQSSHCWHYVQRFPWIWRLATPSKNSTMIWQ